MQLIESVLYLAMGALAVRAQDSTSTTTNAATLSINTAVAATVSRYTYGFNSASTEIYVSTDTAQTPDVYSASGTIQSSVTVPYYNVSSVATSASTTPTASSNFTLPSATATATIPVGFNIQSSNPYTIQAVNTTDLPDFSWSLLDDSEVSRQIICNQQTSFCSTAGCATVNATNDYNFCNVDTMGTRCTCNKGSSNLEQYKWPVEMADCLGRGSACNNACMVVGGTTAGWANCKAACVEAYSNTCGTPGQYAANYAVSKESEKPNLNMQQGGTAGDGAMTIKPFTGTIVVVLACALTFSLL